MLLDEGKNGTGEDEIDINLEITQEREKGGGKKKNDKEHKRESKNLKEQKEKGVENPYSLSDNLFTLVKEALITITEINQIISL